MCLIHFYGLLFMIVFNMIQARQIAYTSGWIPLTQDEVYGRHSKSRLSLNSEGQHTTIDKPKTLNPQASDKIDLYSDRNQAIKLVKPIISHQFGQENIFDPIEPETIKSVNELQNTNVEINRHDCDISHNTATHIPLDNVGKMLDNNIDDLKKRQSKAIIDESQRINTNHLNSKLKGESDSTRQSTKSIRVADNSYEVVEDTAEDLENESSEMDTPGYFYPPPNMKLNTAVQSNITHTFLDILSKHNIKPDDELPNYTLSRKVKAQDRANAFMFIPVPLRVLPQFNNLKQLSVDPLLAVLMSNYGYYFPGSYGIHSRYRNLYGHLASNNIHNNKPFGSYKIFSDTDSSN